MTDVIFETIGKLLAFAAVSAVLYLVPKVKAWLTERIGLEKTKRLMEQINKFVEAAEQLYKADDPTGEIRNNYVKTQLARLNIVITDEINSYIEGLVFEINQK